MKYESRVKRAYRVELWTAVAIYLVLLAASIRYGRAVTEGPWRTAVLLAPMLGFALMIRAVARHVGRLDEYQRLRLLEGLALAFAITGAATFSYGFLETAGYPRLSMFTVWGVMGVSWSGVCAVRAWRDHNGAPPREPA